MKICKICGKEFIPRKESQIYCSKKCAGLSKRKIDTRTCLTCGKQFTINSWRSDKFCSIQCAANFHKKRVVKKCLNCGKEFEIPNYMDKKQHFCSTKCSGEYHSKHHIHKSMEERKCIVKKCLNCGKEFNVYPYRKNAKFCSKKCHYEYGRVNFKCQICGCNYSEEKNVAKNNINVSMFCPKCRTLTSTSAFEIDIRNHLIKEYNECNVLKNQKIQYKQNHYIYPDIILFNKLIIECNGDFFHCNPLFYDKNYFNPKIKKYAHEIWKKDNKKIEIYKKNNYNIITIWESEWKNNKQLILKKIKNEILKNKINQTSSTQ